MATEGDNDGLVFLAENGRGRLPRPDLPILDRLPLSPLRDRLRIDAELPAQFRVRSLRSLYCCSDGVRGRGAAMTYLSHKASFHSIEWIAPTNPGIKRLVISWFSRALVRTTNPASHLLASLIEETPELPRPRRMLQLPQRLRLDLPDPLAGHRKLLADLFESVVGVHPDPEAHAQHTFLARRERRQNPRRRLLQVLLNGRIQRQDGILVLDEVPELTVFLIPDRRLQRDRLLGDLHHLADLLERHLELLGQFLWRRLAADLVEHLAAGAHQLVDRLDHVHRNADGAGLIGDRAGDRLPDPPRRIRAELVAPAILELVDGLHQADVAFLDEIEKLQAAIGIFLGD